MKTRSEVLAERRKQEQQAKGGPDPDFDLPFDGRTDGPNPTEPTPGLPTVADLTEQVVKELTAPPAERSAVEKKGPYCIRCGEAFGGTKWETAAMFALQCSTAITCPTCMANAIPSLEEPDPNAIRPPGIPPEIRGIVESVFQLDYAKEWVSLHKALTLGEERTDYGHVLKALDLAEDNARVAHLLFINVRVEYERYKVDSEVVEAGMRAQANTNLQMEKEGSVAGKARAKMITEPDIRAEMVSLFPDHFRQLTIDRARFKGTVDHAEQLFERWSKRAFALQAIITTMRR